MAHSYAKFDVWCDTTMCGGSITAYVFPAKMDTWKASMDEWLETYGWEVENGNHYCPKCKRIREAQKLQTEIDEGIKLACS